MELFRLFPTAFRSKRQTGGHNLGTASLSFLAYAFAVVIAFNLSASVVWRQFVLLVASLGFLGFFSHHFAAFIPLGAFLIFGFVSLRLMKAGATELFVPLLVIGIVSFLWLKKYSFIPSSLFLREPYITLGFSYIFFRVLHLIIDSHSRYTPLPKNISLVSYLNYTLNFTTLVSGPIQRYNQFASMQLASEPIPLDMVIGGQALERIIVGFFKVNVLSLFLSMIQRNGVNSLASAPPGSARLLTAITIAAVYPFYLYCNFSGYIDIVIGIARFLRMKLPENFNRPFSSQNYLIFWSRWHITLSTWLQIYVYAPLMLSSRRRWPSPSVEPFLNVLAYFVTFFLVGFWHGQTSAFIFFGILLGLGVSMTKLFQTLMTNWLGRERYAAIGNNWFYNTAARGLTFTWCAFTLLWFWSNWSQLRLLTRTLGWTTITMTWVVIFLGASVTLALWEIARDWLLSLKFENRPVLLSRYVRTVWDTALLVISISTIMLMNAPPPDIVYKTF
jgi:D-alanyl-lipoteichoic acid acyltransferase DltB (MBOAT superfamily)